MPWYLKAPLILAVAIGIYNATGLLAGGVGMFPYAGIFASYETRHSLRTLAGHFTYHLPGLLMCLLTIAATENHFAAPLPLLLGWATRIGLGGGGTLAAFGAPAIRYGDRVGPGMLMERSQP